MIPINSKTTPCSPISSNCVIWQGPDIPCINLCNGDTVSDVVAKLADELCSILDQTQAVNIDLSGIDLNCLPQETTKDLESILQAIITYICNLPSATSITNVTLPECLQYQDGLGNTVTELNINDFSTLIGNTVCAILEDITNIETAIAALGARILILENCVLPCNSNEPTIPSVVSSCLIPGTSIPITELILSLESQFCALRSALGTVTVINKAISSQCIYGNTERLASSGTYSALNGWVSNPTTLAETTLDQWLVICDMYAAIKNIQENCCTTGCTNVTFDVSYSAIDNNSDGIIDTINFNFSGSIIPNGFSDCRGSTPITITDINGSKTTANVNVTNAALNVQGIDVDVSSLNTSSSLVVSIPFCVSDNTTQCSDKQNIIIPLEIPCPDPVSVVAAGTNINVNFSNGLGTTATYTIVAVDASNGNTLGSTTIVNPGAAVSYQFTGATWGKTYNIIITVSQGSATKTCPAIPVTMPEETFDSWEVQVCGSTDNYLVSATAWGITPVVGSVYKITNVGDDFVPFDGRPQWPTGLSTCVTIISAQPTTLPEIPSTQLVNGPHVDCVTCQNA